MARTQPRAELLTPKSYSEVGAGGGDEDLNQVHELALNDVAAVEKLIEICTEEITNQEARSTVIDLINNAKKAQKIAISLTTLKLDKNDETIPLAEIAKSLAEFVVEERGVGKIESFFNASSRRESNGKPTAPGTCAVGQKLPRIIVSSIQTSTRCTTTQSCRNFHTRGTLHMKSSAVW